MDRLLTPAYRQLTPLEDQLKELLEKLDLSTAMKHSPSRSKRLKLLKKTILEVRSEMSLKKSLPTAPPTPPEPTPAPAESEEKPLPSPPAEPRARPEEEPFPPPTLELLTSLSQLDTPPGHSEPPLLKPSTDHTPMELDGSSNTSTSVSSDTPDGHTPDPLLYNGDLHAEAPGACSRRTNAIFRKSKSASPQKPPKTQEVSAAPAPPLGAKTFLSVVIPRLETLLLPKKRRRSADGEEEEESPIKRLGTGSDTQNRPRVWTSGVVPSCNLPLFFLRNSKRFRGRGGGGGSLHISSPAGASAALRLRVEHFLRRRRSLQYEVGSARSILNAARTKEMTEDCGASPPCGHTPSACVRVFSLSPSHVLSMSPSVSLRGAGV